mmetsp:Transcript_53262/g.98351  ORF Transcript_53262/g.98351 Transcript_53262/m.98351 type:complete len:529 (-) Transcript_53262:41-1627(-)
MAEVSTVIMMHDMTSKFASTIKSKLFSQQRTERVPTFLVVLLAVLCVLAPFDSMQLIFAFVGAVTYAGVQCLFPGKFATKRKGSNSATVPQKFGNKSCTNRPSGIPGRYDACKRDAYHSRVRRAEAPLMYSKPEPRPAPRPEIRKPSSQPVTAPVFSSQGWNAEVDELIKQLSPTPESLQTIKQITDFIKVKIQPIIPEAEVTGFASGDLPGGTAFGVAVPDVDVVVTVNPSTLAKQMIGLYRAGNPSSFVKQKVDMRKVQKTAIRACTDALVSSGPIKFRRSSFRGEEPKVTLLVTSAFGVHSQAIPVDFAVNGVMAVHNAALLADCGSMDPRAKSLMLMVRRWAKYRGICHAAKGHLSPYAWSLLVIRFLQASHSRLPPFEEFESCKHLKHRQSKASSGTQWSPPSDDGPPKAVGDLFKDFVQFYASSFDLCSEMVSIRVESRAPPGLSRSLPEPQSETKVCIEDPFNPTCNLGGHLTSLTLSRLQDELRRAAALCANGCSLTDLLEPWVPPEQGSNDDDEAGEGA